MGPAALDIVCRGSTHCCGNWSGSGKKLNQRETPLLPRRRASPKGVGRMSRARGRAKHWRRHADVSVRRRSSRPDIAKVRGDIQGTWYLVYSTSRATLYALIETVLRGLIWGTRTVVLVLGVCAARFGTRRSFRSSPERVIVPISNVSHIDQRPGYRTDKGAPGGGSPKGEGGPSQGQQTRGRVRQEPRCTT